MTTTLKILLGAAAACIAVAAGTGVYESHRISQMRGEIQALEEQQKPLTKQIQQLRQERDDATRRLAVVQQEIQQQQLDTAEPVRTRDRAAQSQPSAVTADGAGASGAAGTGGATGATNFFAGVAQMMKDPAMKEMIRSQQQMTINKMYGGLFKSLNRPADQQNALKDLLLDRQMAMMDAGLSMMSGTGADPKQSAEETKALKTEYDQKIQEMLGPQDYGFFQEYEKTVGERTQVQLFKDALPTDAGLTEVQENNLITAMYEERKALPTSSLLNNQTSDPSQLTEERIAEALKEQEQLQQRYAARAASILAPAQLEEFTKFQQQMSTMTAAGMKMAGQMFGGKKASPPSGSQSQTP